MIKAIVTENKIGGNIPTEMIKNNFEKGKVVHIYRCYDIKYFLEEYFDEQCVFLNEFEGPYEEGYAIYFQKN